MQLEERFAERLTELGLGSRPTRVVVALSGGCDSVVLLHLLRLHAAALRLQLVAAHLDHAIRAESGADLLWVRGLCTAWGIPLRHDRLAVAPAGEEAARVARYRFLHSVEQEEGAEHILTAHHADDQAETVLFRIFRGTGLHGLRGIPERSASGVLRPLLPFWREELEAYARSRRLRWRTDVTNRSLDPARNLLRLRVLPLVEESFAPAARRHLVALTREAAEAEAALDRLVDVAEEEVVSRDGEAYLLARHPLLGYDSATAARLLRRVLRRFGTALSRAGTRSALQFITDASSGRVLSLPSGAILRVEFDVVRLERGGAEEGFEPLQIPRPAPGSPAGGELKVGGVSYRVTAQAVGLSEAAAAPDQEWQVLLPADADRYPLLLRGWLPGDRMKTGGGTKTLKKLFLEHRVPRSRRQRLPVLADATGSIVWVSGIGRPPASAPAAGAEAILLTITNV
jgi:tRNA(Ile)-lysidine synthase